MSKILIQVIIPSPQYLRTDIENWDIYGASSALSDEMTLFDSDYFAQNTEGVVARSVKDPSLSWSIRYLKNLNTYPIVAAYDADTKKPLGSISGTPKYRGQVESFLQKIIAENNTSGGLGNTNTKKKRRWAGVLALLSIGFLTTK